MVFMHEYGKQMFSKNIHNEKRNQERDKIKKQIFLNSKTNNKQKNILARLKYNEVYSKKCKDEKTIDGSAKIIRIKKNDNLYKYAIAKAAKIIRKGKLVVFPTETVYGLGANAYDEEAIKRLYEAKERPYDKPLIIHVNSMDMVRCLVTNITEEMQTLTSNFWPGPLTIILPKSITVSDLVTAGTDTVAIRMPDNKIALDLINAANVPIAASSANITGKPSATKAKHAAKELWNKVRLILDGGMSKIGIESTVVSLIDKTPIILREGKISKEQIERVLGKKIKTYEAQNEDQVPQILKYKHYSPNAKIYVAKRNERRLRTIYSMLTFGKKLKQEKKKMMFIFSNELPKSLLESIKQYGKIICFKSKEKMAHEIFDTFRKADNEKIDAIIIEGVEQNSIGGAIMDRLIKAADGEIINYL